MKIHHFGIKVDNIDKSIKFYTEQLGFKIKTPKKTSDDGVYTFSNLDLNGAELEIVQVNEKNKKIKKKEISYFPHFGLESYDLEKDLETLKKRGVKIFEGPIVIPNDVKMFSILDPDNYRIDIGQKFKK